MKPWRWHLWILFIALAAASSPAAAETPAFLRLKILPAPKIIAAAEAFPGGSFTAAELLNGNPGTCYASNNKGTGTFVLFDFGAPVRIAAFRHLDRNDPATVAASQLTFLDGTGKTITTLSIRHVNKPAGLTFFPLPAPITAQRVRWQVTKLGSPYSAVGGSGIAFFGAGETESLPRGIEINAQAIPVVEAPFRRTGTATRGVAELPLCRPVERGCAGGRAGTQAPQTHIWPSFALLYHSGCAGPSIVVPDDRLCRAAHGDQGHNP